MFRPGREVHLPRRSGADRVEHRLRPSRLPISSSIATGPFGRSVAAAPARSGSRATSGPASRSRSRSFRARASAPRAPRARWRPPRACATSAASAPTTSAATAATSTSPTSTCRAARCARRCAAGKLGDRDAVEAAAQILDALAHAHRIGIVHRDVKPSNVLVEEAPAISIRLLDFGLAQFDEADTLTAVGDVPGTLAYIAPERLRGGDATAASDVWAVGVLLWESLAGEHPFWGVPLPQVAAAIEAGATPIGTARPDLPPALADAVSSALAIDPSRRPSAERLAADLRAALASPRRDRSKPARPRQAARPRRSRPSPRSARAAARPGGARRRSPSRFAATLLPFWTPGLVARCSRSLRPRATLRAPAARPRDRALRARLPARQRRPGGRRRVRGARARLARASAGATRGPGLLFVAGPLLAAVGALALLPLAVQPARGRVRRGRCRRSPASSPPLPWRVSAGDPLPLTGIVVPNLGIDGTTDVTDVVQADRGRPAGQRRPRRRRARARRSLLPCCRTPAGAGLRGSPCSASARSPLILVLAPAAAGALDRARHLRCSAPCSRRSRSRAGRYP